MSRIQEYIDRVEQAVFIATNCVNISGTKLPKEVFDIQGMSSLKNRILLNELIKDGDRYLEIGVWRGSTFVSALYGNNPQIAVAIDNFSQFADLNENPSVSDVFVQNSTRFLEPLRGRVGFLNADCFNLTSEQKLCVPGNVNVYFYDGGHEAPEQKAALTYYDGTLADEFIFIVDDWNYEPARIGTRQAFEELGTIIHKEWELFSDHNGDTSSWWNGFYLAVCEKRK